jgi:PTS system ascorbate-specific IIA component
VLALAGASSARHLQLVAEIANIFNDSDAVERIADATTADEVRSILGVGA